eukprot:CAMPEP_0206155532 /NCGR_PEP_ID=MMETSP1474-20131121/2184_1 /ASSEMBLY_ACC=CAM_ASM_001110 /TAXON_ID=97495 /ORGANISM="Imantonia sp., Strain RCC918" /LENGTH=63 /DNA_ID=CAMNT_0053554215 /DNA_START=306 /DNA_END=495 /DNA_ORIENTATION=+
MGRVLAKGSMHMNRMKGAREEEASPTGCDPGARNGVPLAQPRLSLSAVLGGNEGETSPKPRST